MAWLAGKWMGEEHHATRNKPDVARQISPMFCHMWNLGGPKKIKGGLLGMWKWRQEEY